LIRLDEDLRGRTGETGGNARKAKRFLHETQRAINNIVQRTGLAHGFSTTRKYSKVRDDLSRAFDLTLRLIDDMCQPRRIELVRSGEVSQQSEIEIHIIERVVQFMRNAGSQLPDCS